MCAPPLPNSAFPPGKALTAQVTDDRGGVATTAPIQIVVNAPPTTTLAAQAADADGNISKVDFYQGQTLLGSATQAPYAYTWKPWRVDSDAVASYRGELVFLIPTYAIPRIPAQGRIY